MDDLSTTISKVLSDPESVRQLQQVAASLGLSGNGQQNSPPSQPPAPVQSGSQGGNRQSNAPLNWTMGGSGRGNSRRQNQHGQQRHQPEPPQGENDMSYIKGMLEQLVENTRPSLTTLPVVSTPEPQSQSGGFDMGALSGILSGLSGNSQEAATPAAPSQDNSGGLDLSALSGILGNLGAGSANDSGGANLDALPGILSGLIGSGSKQVESSPSGVSALTAMLGGGADEGRNSGSNSLGGMNMGMLLKFQQAMSSLSTGSENVRLMMALKGQLKDDARTAKVDDAVKVMQVIQFLPILKESGIFGKLEDIMDGVNLGGLLGGSQNSGGGLSSVLGGLQNPRGGGLTGILNSLTGRR